MPSLLTRQLIAVISMLIGLLVMGLFVTEDADWTPFVWLLLVSFGVGMILNHWSAILVPPVTYWASIVIVTAIYTGTWEVLLPGSWLDPSGGEDLTLYLLLPLALAGTFGWASRQLIDWTQGT